MIRLPNSPALIVGLNIEIEFIKSALQVFLTPQYLVIAMEYIPGGDVVTYVERHRPKYQLPESQARWIFQQLLIGLDYCHCKVGCFVQHRTNWERCYSQNALPGF